MATVGPHHIDIRPWQAWADATATPTRSQNSVNLGGGLVFNTSKGSGNFIAWDVPLIGGTWRLTVIGGTFGDGDPALEWTLDATSIGTISQNAGSATNLVATITGITVITNGVYRLKATTSGAYYYRIQHISLDRTGA